jgi:hypothetical protein
LILLLANRTNVDQHLKKKNKEIEQIKKFKEPKWIFGKRKGQNEYPTHFLEINYDFMILF